jgi:hypothetical protein
METATKPRFTTIQDVIDDPKCSEMIDSIIKEIKGYRNKLKYGVKELRRSAFYCLINKRLTHSDNIIQQFELIARKQAPLPANVQLLITQIVMNAVKRTVIFYNKLDKAK